MKKTFPLNAPGIARPRVVERIKHDVRKYVKRERNKDLPTGFDVWEFTCRVGPAEANAAPTSLKEIGAAIDVAATEEATCVYVEVIAVPSHRSSAVVTSAEPPL